jgi:small subunit ribosomal protein S16
MKIRLARGGSKKRPFYRIVAADSRMPRDGRFIERLGTYNPLLPKDSEERVKMNVERIQYWMGQGAQPTDRIARMLEAAGVVPATTRANPRQALPGEKAVKRAEEKAAKATAAAEAAAAPAAAAAEVPAAEPAKEPTEEPAADVAEEPAADVAQEPAAEATEDAAAGDAEASEQAAGKAVAE